MFSCQEDTVPGDLVVFVGDVLLQQRHLTGLSLNPKEEMALMQILSTGSISNMLDIRVLKYSSITGILKYSSITGILKYSSITGILKYSSITGILKYSSITGILKYLDIHCINFKTV